MDFSFFEEREGSRGVGHIELDAADARILGPLLCEVDASYFRQEFTTLRLSRTTTRMQNGERCDFRFTW